MAVVLRRRDETPEQPARRSWTGTFRTRALQRSWAGRLSVNVASRAWVGRLRTDTVGLARRSWSGTLRTQDVTPPPVLPPDTSGVVADRMIAPPPSYRVLIGGFGNLAVDSFSYQEAAETERATLEFKVQGQDLAISGNLMLGATATPKWSGLSFGAVYGPTQPLTDGEEELTAIGWVTTFRTQDTTASDAEPFQQPMEELVPWEKEKQLTSLEQLQKQRADTLRQRQLSKLKCADRRAAMYDDRSMLVADLAEQVRARLGVTSLWAKPFPFPAARIYAAEYVTVNGVEYKAASLSTKDQKPRDWLSALLGSFGWVLRQKGGLIILGPPEQGDLIPAGGTAAFLGVAQDLLTSVKRRRLEPGTGVSDSPRSSTGSNALPWQAKVTVAPKRKYLPPLPPEDDQDQDATFKDGTFTDQFNVYRTDGSLESTRATSVTKRGGLLTEETERVDGVIPVQNGFRIVGDQASGFQVVTEVWGERSQRSVKHFYEDSLFTQTETRSVTESYAVIPGIVGLPLQERTEVTKTFGRNGYLQRLTTSSLKFNSVNHSEADFNGDGESDDIRDVLVYSSETTVETWLELGGGLWLYNIQHTGRRLQPMYANGNLDSSQNGLLLDGGGGPTDTPPEKASLPNDDDCPDEPDKGDPYDEETSAVRYTGGRGDAVTYDIPWLFEVPDIVFGLVLDLATERNEITYALPVPIQVPVTGAVRSLSVTGGPADVTTTITVLEAVGGP